jgi:hypothetical protein
MRSAVEIMSRFEVGHEPPIEEVSLPNRTGDDPLRISVSIREIVSDQYIGKWLEQKMASLPPNMFSTFVSASAVLGQIYDGFNVSAPTGVLDLLDLSDPKTMSMFMALGSALKMNKEFQKENGNPRKGADPPDPLGMRELLLQELNRRALSRRAPFGRTVTTLLGPSALQWLTAKSRDGFGKIQPHEFSRDG